MLSKMMADLSNFIINKIKTNKLEKSILILQKKNDLKNNKCAISHKHHARVGIKRNNCGRTCIWYARAQ